MKEFLNEFGPWLNGAGIVTFVTLFFARRKTNAETKKILTEDNELAQNKEITLVKFYREQVENLTKSYELLAKKFEEKENENIDCEVRLNALENKYNAILSKVNLLEKNIKS